VVDIHLLNEIKQLNPWIEDPSKPIISEADFIPRTQLPELMDPEWDKLWTVLVGPRRAGKTTLGKYLSQQLIHSKRYNQLLYLNCDYLSIRQWLSSPLFVSEAISAFSLTNVILFIDEIQRVENPGLLLKAIIDLGLPIKHIATGSSQLEIKSKVQEFLTGRQLASLILPLNHEEWKNTSSFEELVIYGCYPQVVKSSRKEIQLTEIYNNYIQKDIIEILQVGKPDVFQNLISLLAHCSGQLINYNQLATDCKVNVLLIRNYLDILEQTYVISKIKPFVGNKRVEITSNPIYYFVDNGFRNVALRNFSGLSARTDMGLLIENFVFQEILKFKTTHYLLFDIHFWRTKSGAEVDFVLYKNESQFIPIEVKYRNTLSPGISKGYRSFIEAYRPGHAIVITNGLIANITVEDCQVHFIPLEQIDNIFMLIRSVIQ
jgi:hypothetical protein